ncbi:MAG: DoxX family protein [Pseudomonadota bacterium]
MGLIRGLNSLYEGVFFGIQRATEAWLIGLAARLTFASVLLMYFLNSALTKVGSSFPEILIPTTNAYAQIVPKVMEEAGFDATQIAFFPHGLMVYAGTYAEFILPVLIVIGLWTRAASLGMLGFIAVMTYVDITAHGADAATIGGFFDRVQDAAISDQRLLWAFPLLYLVLRGPGAISFDAVLGLTVREEPI